MIETSHKHLKAFANMQPLQKREAAAGEVFCKQMFSKISQNSKVNTCVGVPFLIRLQACQGLFFNKLQAEFCEVFKNVFFYGTLPVAASEKFRFC